MDGLTPERLTPLTTLHRLVTLQYEVHQALKAGLPVVFDWVASWDGPRSIGQEFRVLIGKPAVEWEAARLVEAVRGAPVAPVEATTPPAATSAGSDEVKDGTGPG